MDALKEVLRRVGKPPNVKRYNPSNPNACEWLDVTMYRFPYLGNKNVIVDVLVCTECGAEVLRQKVYEHCEKRHGGHNCKAIQEFSWVVSYMKK